MNYLAHGLYDPESWLAQYGREERLKAIRLQERTSQVLKRGMNISDTSSSATAASASAKPGAATTGATQPGKRELPLSQQAKAIKEFGEGILDRIFGPMEDLLEDDYYGDVFHPQENLDATPDAQGTIPDTQPASTTPSSKANKKLSRFKYNASLPIYVYLPGSAGSVQLPHPLGQGSPCTAALVIMKHLAEYSYRTNDLTVSRILRSACRKHPLPLLSTSRLSTSPSDAVTALTVADFDIE